MKTLFIVICLLAFTPVLLAQNCNQDQLSKRPGKWIPSALKGHLYDVTAKELAAEKPVLDKIAGMIRTGYNPVGVAALHWNVFGFVPGSGTNWIANPFYYTITFKKYLCHQNKEYINGEALIDAMATFHICANRMEWIAPIAASDFAVDNKEGYVMLLHKPVEKNGIYFFDLAKEPGHLFEAALITKNGQLPYKYASRKEFLLVRKAHLEKRLKEYKVIAERLHPVRTAAQQQAAKEAEIAGLKKEKYSQPYIDRFIKDYKTDEQKRDAALAVTHKSLGVPLDLVTGLLNNSSAEELNAPAIILSQDAYYGFTGFVTDEKGYYLIKPNIEYYDKKLPKSAPQFFTIFLSCNSSDPVYLNAINGVKKTIDYQALKNMLQ